MLLALKVIFDANMCVINTRYTVFAEQDATISIKSSLRLRDTVESMALHADFTIRH